MLLKRKQYHEYLVENYVWPKLNRIKLSPAAADTLDKMLDDFCSQDSEHAFDTNVQDREADAIRLIKDLGVAAEENHKRDMESATFLQRLVWGSELRGVVNEIVSLGRKV